LIGSSVIGSILALYDWEKTRYLYILVLIILFIESVISDRSRWRNRDLDERVVGDNEDSPEIASPPVSEIYPSTQPVSIFDLLSGTCGNGYA
jgi:hypothetical protein